MSKYSLRLAYLYPKLLNIYGDNGNVLVLKKRCEWRGIDLIIDEIDVNDNISENLYDLYFIGGGQDKQQIEASKALMRQKENLMIAQENNAVMLSICGGYQLFGEYYEMQNGEKIQGINLLDIYTLTQEKRQTGNVVSSCLIPNIGNLVGFENHCGTTFIKENSKTKPLAKITTGFGNNGKDKFEGAYKKNVFGTYLHGSFLPKNPLFADYLLQLALTRKYFEQVNLQPLDDNFANLAHQNALLKKN